MLDVKQAMIRRYPSLVCVLLCLFAACGGSRCDASTASTPHQASSRNPPAAKALPVIKPPRPDLRLVVTTDARGYLEPCGCQLRPLGGLDKLATVVAEARSTGVPLLLLSAGDFAVGTELRPDDAAEAQAQEAMRARTFVEIWRRLAPAAITPGRLDLAQSASWLAEQRALGSFPWLVDNASVASAEPRTPKQAPAPSGAPFGRARIVEVEGIKVGVLGLVAPDPAEPATAPIVLADDLSAVAEAQSRSLRQAGAQLVVALVVGDRRTARMVASRGPDVVLMGGLRLEQPLPPSHAGNAILLHAGQQGQYAVTVDLGLGQPDAGDPTWEDASNWTRREERKELEQQIQERRARIAGWEKDHSAQASDLEAQRERLRELEAERDAPHPPRFAGRWFFADLVALVPEVPGDREVASVLDAHDVRVNEHNRVSLAGHKPQPAPAGTASYAGSESCASCHQAAYAWWQTTKHGHAYATLEAVHKEFSLSCVSCHVVGYNQPGGSTVTHVDKLKDVGCENCHGPGSLHNAQPKLPGLVTKAVPEAVCTGCHTHEHSDRFEYTSFRQLMIAPGHGKPSDRQ